MYFFISIFCLIFCFLSLNKLAGIGNLRRPNVMSIIFYLYFFIQFFFASLLVVYNLDDHYILNKLSNNDSRYYGWLAINAVFILFPLGVWLSNIVFLRVHSSVNYYERYLEKPVVTPLGNASDKDMNIVLGIFLLLCIVLLYYVISNIGFLGLKEMIFGVDVGFSSLRQDASKQFGGNVFVKNQFLSNILPVATCVSYSFFIRRRTFLSRILFIGFLSISILALTYDFSKAPIIYLLIGLLFVNLYHSGYIKLRYSLYFVGVLIAVLLAQYYVLTSYNIPIALNGGPIGRLLISQSTGLFLAFDYFGTQHDYLWFSSLSSFLSELLGSDSSPRAARLLLEHYNGSAVERGAGGVINSLFVQEAYANFGWGGVVIAPTWVGFVCQSMMNLFIRLPKNDFMVGLQAKMIIGGAVAGGFNDYFYRPSLFIFIVICVLTYFIYLLIPKRTSVEK